MSLQLSCQSGLYSSEELTGARVSVSEVTQDTGGRTVHFSTRASLWGCSWHGSWPPLERMSWGSVLTKMEAMVLLCITQLEKQSVTSVLVSWSHSPPLVECGGNSKRVWGLFRLLGAWHAHVYFYIYTNTNGPRRLKFLQFGPLQKNLAVSPVSGKRLVVTLLTQGVAV